MSYNIISAGIGGQGVLFANKILCESAHRRGEKIMTSENHGMSQRGGSVFSHLKIGHSYSPLVRRGTADLLYIFEQDEIFSNLSFVKERGIIFINTPSTRFLPQDLKNILQNYFIQIYALPASEIAGSIGNILAANLVLLGFSLAWEIPFSKEEIALSIEISSPDAVKKTNLLSFEKGYQEGSNYKKGIHA
jgi:indolepyruvate ferredoxin oxidoreductase beta subunit